MKRGTLVYRKVPVAFINGEWHHKLEGPFKVMGLIDGYLMLRHPRAMPFVLSISKALDADGNKIEA